MIVTLLTCNRIGFTKATISSFLGHNKNAKDYTWVVLDNGSKDETLQYLKEKGLFTAIIAEKDNIGLHPGMQKLFHVAQNIDPEDNYMIHLENDWWSEMPADFNLMTSILDDMQNVGMIQMRDLEEEYALFKKWNKKMWSEEHKTVKHHITGEPVDWIDQFEIDGRRFALTNWFWNNAPAVFRTEIAKKLFDNIDFNKFDGRIEFELMRRYHEMNYLSLKDLPGTFYHFGYIEVGKGISKTEGARYL